MKTVSPACLRATKPPGVSSGRLSVLALFLPGILFGLALYLLRDNPRFIWLADVRAFPWELWAIAGCGSLATVAGAADWIYHRSGRTTVGAREHHFELLALAAGGLPVFVLMAAASMLSRPQVLLLPVIVMLLFTAVLICYDEFVFHRKRCRRFETILHRLLVFGHGLALLAWMHWCFVRGAGRG